MEKYLTDMTDVEITKEELESLGIIPKINEDKLKNTLRGMDDNPLTDHDVETIVYNIGFDHDNTSNFGQNENGTVHIMNFEYGDIPEYKRI